MADSKQTSQDAPTVIWDDSAMTTGFANVVNIQSSQEQVDIFMGTNQTWNPSGDSNEVRVQLAHRVIMTPIAAKRMATALNGVLEQYEARYGELKDGASS
jgi:hypothetical protein